MPSVHVDWDIKSGDSDACDPGSPLRVGADLPASCSRPQSPLVRGDMDGLDNSCNAAEEFSNEPCDSDQEHVADQLDADASRRNSPSESRGTFSNSVRSSLRRSNTELSNHVSRAMVSLRLAPDERSAASLRDDMFFKVASPLGLVKECYVVDHTSRHQRLRLVRPRNACFCLVALSMYVIVAIWFALTGFEIGSENALVSVETTKWSNDSSPLPKIWVKAYDKGMVVKVKHCKIHYGNYSGYKHYSRRNVIHPTGGGCSDAGQVFDMSALLNVDVQQGGCKHFPGQAYNSCFYLAPADVTGQFGDPTYEFSKVKVLYPDPVAANSTPAEVAAQLLRSETKTSFELRDPPSVPLVENESPSYSSLYFTETMEKVHTVEMFFRRVSLERFTNLDLGAKLFIAGARKAMHLDDGAQRKAWTEFDSHYVRHDKFEDAVSGKRVALEFVLRATAMEYRKLETPKTTWVQLPEMMGGFFTGFVVFGVSLVMMLGSLGSRIWRCISKRSLVPWLEHSEASSQPDEKFSSV